MNYQYNGYSTQPLNPALEQEYLLALKKEQERIAIRGILKGMKSTIRRNRRTQEEEFKRQSRVMKNYLENTVTKNLEEAYTGQAAKNAKEYLKAMKEPTFTSPMT